MRTNQISRLLTSLRDGWRGERCTAGHRRRRRALLGDARGAPRVVVSIPDRKLALLENDQVVGIYPVAVGASVSPSPVGTFTIVSRVSNPTVLQAGKGRRPRPRESGSGTRWIGLSAKGSASTAPTHPAPSAPPSRTAASAFATRMSNSSLPASAAATSSSSMPNARRRSRSCSAISVHRLASDTHS